ncbi:PorP/SprF family type IX secretion system membrane protein, partial [Flavobacterium sp. PL002]|uniref:PorP/SprF family type IX secretion system membrane protein n=1 Tax=Flavobacterium sp. PL002 TaxID=1897058 RepID=UPI0017885974
MKKILLFVSLFYGFSPKLYSQDTNSGNGVVSFAIPVRNSLKYNLYTINPAFSFVRQNATYASFYNKRQWVAFQDAPQTYLVSYSGRFSENEGLAIGLFQQNYGLLTTFGVIGNFAHNIVLQEDSNLTLGINVAGYKSGLNNGKVIVNTPDPALDNIPSNTLLSVSPGINYGNAFIDFGVAMNNLALYNFATSEIIKEDLEKSLQVHLMYTGFLDTYGFFDNSKFSALVRSEFKKEKTVISGVGMLTIPQGAWIQAGYNTVYGMSAGLGVNITPTISIEYNYERGTGNFANFGASHEFLIAYRFKSKTYYYGDDEEEGALLAPTSKAKTIQGSDRAPYIDAETRAANAQAKIAANAQAKADAEAVAKEKLAADARAKADAEAAAKAKLAADAKAKADADARANVDAQPNDKAKLAADAKAKADAEAAKAKLAADARAKADAAAANARMAADLQANKDAKAKLAADAKAKADAEAAKAKLAADA